MDVSGIQTAKFAVFLHQDTAQVERGLLKAMGTAHIAMGSKHPSVSMNTMITTAGPGKQGTAFTVEKVSRLGF